MKEIKTNQNTKAVFEKYLEIAENFYAMNRRIGQSQVNINKKHYVKYIAFFNKFQKI